MKGCPDCDGRQKAIDDQVARECASEEDQIRRSKRDEAYLAGFVGGGMTLGMPAAWLHEWTGGPAYHIPMMILGIALGIGWVYWRGDKFGTMR